MVAVATNLCHDGIASPVSSLEHESGKGSYGVALPVAVMVDLDGSTPRPADGHRRDRGRDQRSVRGGRLGARGRAHGGAVDGLAATMARSAAQAVLHQPGDVALGRVPDRAGGVADPVRAGDVGRRVQPPVQAAAITRSCTRSTSSTRVRPATASSRAWGRCSAPTCGRTPGRPGSCRPASRRHNLPRSPGDLGLSAAEFTKAVVTAPSTRPGRYTILEHLGLTEAEAGTRVEEYVRSVAG